VLSLCFSTQEVLTATLDLEDVRSYKAEISSRNLEVSALGDASLSAQAGLAGAPVCCGLGQGHEASMWNQAEICQLVPFP
jgi:hypothetical protein